MILNSIDELKSAIKSDFAKFKFPFEQQDINNILCNPLPDAFEAVLVDEKSKEKLLIPTEAYYTYLFRGQSEEHPSCIPSLYRGKPTDAEVFTERMKLIEFSDLMDTHPVVNGFFRKHNFRVDHTGLAQHYKIKTDVLDFTSNLDIAIFFAICPYDEDTDSYTYVDDTKDHEAIIYIILPFMCTGSPGNVLGDKIYPIGLQPLLRPGMQRGFAYKLEPEESINGFICRFKYTSADSKYYYDRYEQGAKLWTKDDVIEKAEAIVSKTEFSYRVFKKAWDHYKPKWCSKTLLKKMLSDIGVSVSTKYSEEQFTDEEHRRIIDEWNSSKGANVISTIVRKGWFDKEEDSYIDPVTFKRRYIMENKKPYRNLSLLGEIEALRIMMPDLLTTCGEGVNYNIEYAKTHPKPPKETEWKKVNAKLMDENGQCYLVENDYLI